MPINRKYYTIRKITTGWLSHAIHSTDISERIFRIFLELVLIIFFIFFVLYNEPLKIGSLSYALISIVICHTIMWLLDGNFWVYMLDSFNWLKNPGIHKIISYVKLCKKLFLIVDAANAILIYGSMCRGEFHERSDLDLRVIRRKDSLIGLLCLPIAFILRMISFFKFIPVDLQVVDSTDFLTKQMRKDEIPIIVYLRDKYHLNNNGKNFSEVEENPYIIFIEK